MKPSIRLRNVLGENIVPLWKYEKIRTRRVFIGYEYIAAPHVRYIVTCIRVRFRRILIKI